MEGNNEIEIGGKHDTGRKWIDSDGAAHVIYQKTLSVGALPNTAPKNVAHGEAIALTKYAKIVSLRADNGALIKNETSAGVSVEIDAANVVVTTTSDLSLFVNGIVTIEFCL